MPLPTLTAAEIKQVTAQKVQEQSFADTMQASLAGQQAQADKYAITDGAFKKFMDYYNGDIIGQYDAERKALNGQYIAAPVVESDVVNPATLTASRTTPISPVTDIIRIPEFDGSPLISTIVNETQHIADQAVTENTLVNGYPPFVTYSATLTTTSALTPLSTTLDVTDTLIPVAVSNGATFIITDGVNLAVLTKTGESDIPGGPPYLATLNVTQVVSPASTIASGQSLISFAGFTNGERSAKTASNPNLQGLMNFLIARLQSQINSRISRLNEQLAALAANQDPDGTSQITTATTNANTAKTFLTNYLITTDISDVGISSLAAERATRSSQITARLAQIVANYTGQTLNYFDQRYTFANNRANTSRGTLRLQKNAEAVKASSQTYAAGALDAVAALNSILP